MRRALIALALAVLAAGVLLAWAVRPIVDDLGRSCGGGVFSVTQPDTSDDSYLDVCSGLRDDREQVIQPVAVVVGLVLIGCLGWVMFSAWERRNRLT
jgi:hypothetical protein